MEEKKITLIDYTGKEFSFSEIDKFLSFLQEEIDFWRNISVKYDIPHESKYYKLLSNLAMKDLFYKEIYDFYKNNIDGSSLIGKKIDNDLINYINDIYMKIISLLMHIIKGSQIVLPNS